MTKRLFSLILCVVMLCSMLSATAWAEGSVAKVGNVEYATLDEALANWKANTTLTLLADAKMSDVFKMKSTEHHLLNLGTYTLTAADGKNAFEIIASGTGSAERSALTISADATTPGGIDAGSKAIVFYDYTKGTATGEDRPIIKINGGVFKGSTASFGTAGIYTRGTAARKCATLNISGGTFNCSIVGNGKSKLLISGGTFNYSVGSQGDSTCYRLISGGKFKSFGFMTADANNKFGIGSALKNYDRGCYVDENGYLVVGGPVVTEPGTQYEVSTAYDAWNNYLKFSSAAANKLYWATYEEALKKASSKDITVYTDHLDLKGNTSFKGTLILDQKDSTFTVSIDEGATPAWKVGSNVKDHIALYTRTVSGGVEQRTYFLVPIVVNPAGGGAVAAVDPTEQGKGAASATAKTGYYFDHWTIDTAAGSQTETVETIAVDPNAIPTLITAYFTAKESEATPAASFAANKLVGLEAGVKYSISANNGAAAEYTADAAGELAVEDGWYGATIRITKIATDYKHLDSAAQSLEIPARYTVTYVVEGVETSKIVLAGETAPAYEGALIKGGHLFAGWATAAGEPYDLNTPVQGDVTIYAQWALKPAQTITFDTTERTATYGDGALEARIATAEGAITYSSSDESIATVDANGVVTVLKAGEVVITAAAAETATHAYGESSYTLKIEKAVVKVTAENAEAYAGEALPSFTYKVEGFIGTDAFVTAPSITCDAAMEQAGTYAIIPANGDAGSNYTITYVNGTLTVKPKLVVRVEEPAEEKQGGEVSADKEDAVKGEVVELNLEMKDGFKLDKLVVTDTNGKQVELTPVGDSKYTFVMPEYDVVINASFVKKDCAKDESCPLSAYSDLKADAWYHNGVHYCIENGLMNGISEESFAPHTAATRAMVVVVLWRMEGCPVAENEIAFDDVAENGWYTEAIRWAAANGLIKGYGDGRFGTTDVCTREQMAVILHRYAQMKGQKADAANAELDFADAADISAWATKAMNWACSEGIIIGKPAKVLDPKMAATRAEATLILQRFCEE